MNEARGVTDPLDCFHLFIPMEFYNEILVQTNLYAEQVRASSQGRIRVIKPVSIYELMTFIGLVIAMGVVCLPDYRDYWSTDPLFSNIWFRSVMSRDRFCVIKRYLHVVDNSLNSPTNTDKLWKVRPMIELLQEKCISMYSPHQQLSVDESMIGTKCRLSFLQYMPKKPMKWGIKVWVCSDSVCGYVATFDVYTGADPAMPSYPKGLAHYVVTKLLRPSVEKDIQFTWTITILPQYFLWIC